MTDRATMPIRQEEADIIFALDGDYAYEPFHNCTDAKSRRYIRHDKYDSLAAVAEEMSNAAALICMGYSNLDGQVELERALTSYNALMKGKEDE